MRSLGYDVRTRFRSLTRRSDDAYPEYSAYVRRPRRALIAAGIASLALIGVAGTYFALADGLGGWLLGSAVGGPGPSWPATPGVVRSSSPSTPPNSSPTPLPAPASTGLDSGRPAGVAGRTATGVGNTPTTHRATSSPTTSAAGPTHAPHPSASPSPSESETPSDPPTSSDPSPSESPSPSATDSEAPSAARDAVATGGTAGAERGGWSSSTISTAGA